MNKLLLAASCCLLLASPAMAMPQDECMAQFKVADANSDGTLRGPEAASYTAMLSAAGKTAEANGDISQAVFLQNCQADVFKTAATGMGNTTVAAATAAASDDVPPLKGANSFTEAQAKDRVMAAGFASVSAFSKDADGIWRGTASKGGKTMNVAVDYKGNVVGS